MFKVSNWCNTYLLAGNDILTFFIPNNSKNKNNYIRYTFNHNILMIVILNNNSVFKSTTDIFEILLPLWWCFNNHYIRYVLYNCITQFLRKQSYYTYFVLKYSVKIVNLELDLGVFEIITTSFESLTYNWFDLNKICVHRIVRKSLILDSYLKRTPKWSFFLLVNL